MFLLHVLHSYKKKGIAWSIHGIDGRKIPSSEASMLRHRRRFASSSSSSSSWVHVGLATDSDVPSRSIRPTRAPPLRRSWADFFPFERGACAPPGLPLFRPRGQESRGVATRGGLRRCWCRSRYIYTVRAIPWPRPSNRRLRGGRRHQFRNVETFRGRGAREHHADLAFGRQPGTLNRSRETTKTEGGIEGTMTSCDVCREIGPCFFWSFSFYFISVWNSFGSM